MHLVQDKAKYHGGKNAPQVIVLHATAGYPAGDLAVLRGLTKRQVSVHFLVLPDGTVHQFLPLNVAAFHVGFSVWKGQRNLNSKSIGIEFSIRDYGKDGPTAEQVHAGTELIAYIDKALGKALPIVAHGDIDTRGKTDPGPHFPLRDFKTNRGVYINAPTKPVTTPHVPPALVKVGSTGHWVDVLHTVLAAHKCPVVNAQEVKAHKFGPSTRAAVVKFQKRCWRLPTKANRAKWDGIVGPDTWGKLGVK